MMKRTRTTITGSMLVGLLLVGSVTARGGDYNLGLAYLYGYQGYPYTTIQTPAPTPPYFALHPPVYYGQRYARPYGASPFAAWPQLQANSSYRPMPHTDRWQTIPVQPGPCCQSSSPTHQSITIKPTTPPEPLVIDNPYFRAEEDQAGTTRPKFTRAE